MQAAIIGTGLIGGSIGLALRRAGLAEAVHGFDADERAAHRARDLGAVDEIHRSISAAVSKAEMVFVATPVDTIPGVLEEAGRALKPDAVMTDVGSTKHSITSFARDAGISRRFIAGHPIAGSDAEGIEWARADLFEGSFWILCPDEDTDAQAYGDLTQTLKKIGATVLALDATRHDELVALTSHLPQVLASALMGFTADITSGDGGLPLVTAGGFRDMTRIAQSSPRMWAAILQENWEAVSEVLDRFIDRLLEVRGLIGPGRADEITEWMSAARAARRALPEKPGMDPMAASSIAVTIPDRPGVLAEVATSLGEAGINIEDLQIVHSTGHGYLQITLASEQVAMRAIDLLSGRGYKASLVP